MKAILKNRSKKGVTLTELLVVLAIISLLATLAVPVYVNRTEQARRATARAEVRNIADAQELVAATHQFYVPIHILDNLPNDDSFNEERDDFENDPNSGDKFLIDPFTSIPAQEGNQISFNDAQQILNGTPSGSAVGQRAANLIAFWSGPFLNPARVTFDIEEDIDDQNEISADIVLDPWGNPYIFFSPLGPMSNFSDLSDLSNFDATDTNGRIDFDSGEIQDAVDTTDPFDRFAIVSYGPDGLLDTANGNNNFVNDVFYQFGFIANETAFNIF